MNMFMRYDGFISGRNVKTTEDHIGVDFKLPALAVSEIFKNDCFVDGEVGNGSRGVNAICSRPKAADDVISGEDAETFQEYV